MPTLYIVQPNSKIRIQNRRLIGEVTPHVPLRRAQYQHLGEADFILDTARGIVSAKLSHQRVLLMRHNPTPAIPEITTAVVQLENALHSLTRKENLNSLRGLEGSATAAYFRGYRCLFRSDWGFSDRNRCPPADPVNVLLSFGYTLLAQAASGAVQTVGLDPYAGFLHEVTYNHPALAFDLMEEFRPVIDGLVLWACRSGQINPDDFSPGPTERPILLGEEGRKRFLRAYEQRMDQAFTHPLRGVRLPLRQCLVEQARQIADRLQQNQPGFRSMGFR